MRKLDVSFQPRPRRPLGIGWVGNGDGKLCLMERSCDIGAFHVGVMYYGRTYADIHACRTVVMDTVVHNDYSDHLTLGGKLIHRLS